MKQLLRDIWRVLPTIVVWKILLVLVALAVIPLIPLQYPMTAVRDLSFVDFGLNLPYWVKAWGNFDGFYYMAISKNGYQPGILPFFPLYPILIHLFRELFDMRRIIVGQSISLLSFIGAMVVAYRLFALDIKQGKKYFWLFFLSILTFPTAFFYTAIYNDSLFFLFAILSIYFARTNRFMLASIAGIFATLTRLNGIVLFPYLLLEYAEKSLSINEMWQWKKLLSFIQISLHKKQAWKDILPLFLIPLTFLGYLIYIQIVFTDWHILFQAMNTWGQDRFILPPQVIWRYFKILTLAFNVHSYVWWVAVFEFSAVVFYTTLLIISWKKIRFSYWMFFALSILIPWCTGTFQGMPRYGLHVYPMYLVIYQLLQPASSIKRCIYIAIMVSIAICALTLFTRGIFVS